MGWRLTAPPPYNKVLTKKRLPAAVRAPLFWEAPGTAADGDACGKRCALYEDGDLVRISGSSRFARFEVLCAKCAEDSLRSRQHYVSL